MTAILCNLPLECFEPRQRFTDLGIELLTYGPPDRMLVDGVHYPFDLAFDPSRDSLDSLLQALPSGFSPDLILIYWPDQEPLPRGLEHAKVPVVGIVSDYNLSLDATAGLAPFFDVLLCDSGGVELFERLGFADVRAFVQYSYKASSHRIRNAGPRDIDIGFVGNLNPLIQADREPYLRRMVAMRARGVQAEVTAGIHGAAYGEFLNRTKLGFNRSVRGEMNLRGFEVPACGAVLLMESSNREVRDLFEPGEEVVLYDEHDFEDVVVDLLADDERRVRIARAGSLRVREYAMSKRITTLVDSLGDLTQRRTPATPAQCAIARARAMSGTWADNNAKLAALVEAQRLAPNDPRVLNDIATTMLLARSDLAARAVNLYGQALAASPNYVPAATNLLWLAERGGNPSEIAACRDALDARAHLATDWPSRDGLLLPGGFTQASLARNAELIGTLRSESVLA